MINHIFKILSDLLDDHNVIFYGLMLIAILTPDLRSEITSGILGFWVREKVTGGL